MASIDKSISYILSYARDDAHGYILGGGHGVNPSYANGCDCSGLARLYVSRLLDRTPGEVPDFSTRTEERVLRGLGFNSIPFSTASLRRGDILLSTARGHTVIWLGNGTIVGAEGDWDKSRGDGSGNEVCVKGYYPYQYGRILRYESASKGVDDSMTDAQLNKLLKAANEILRTDDAANDGRHNGLFKRVAWIDRRVRCLDKFDARIGAIEKSIADIKSKLDI